MSMSTEIMQPGVHEFDRYGGGLPASEAAGTIGGTDQW